MPGTVLQYNAVLRVFLQITLCCREEPIDILPREFSK